MRRSATLTLLADLRPCCPFTPQRVQRATTAQSLAATIEDEPAPIEALNPDAPPHL